jgi:hypothetical protein
MQDYITGRVKLKDVSSRTKIKNIQDKNKKLTFVREADGSILVDQVPAVYGVRCGAKLDGFIKGSDSHVTPVRWPKSAGKGKNVTCTLEDLMKENNVVKATDTMVFQTPVVYCTQVAKVDTKDYGLPQTRQRTYMLVWRPENDNVHDDLGKYWCDIVEHLKSPTRHSSTGSPN